MMRLLLLVAFSNAEVGTVVRERSTTTWPVEIHGPSRSTRHSISSAAFSRSDASAEEDDQRNRRGVVK